MRRSGRFWPLCGSAQSKHREQPVTGNLVCHVENSCIGRVSRIRSEKWRQSADKKGGTVMNWETPSFVEVKMDAEINAYQDDFGDIPDVQERPTPSNSDGGISP